MKDNLYLDVHILQTLPPSCVNRDDTGSPKTAIYGGVSRARVSSQSWKRAVRKDFLNILNDGNRGYRTKKVEQLIADRIVSLDSSINQEKAQKLADTACSDVGMKGSGKDVLFFVSEKQIQSLAKAIIKAENEEKISQKERKKILENAANISPSIDMALFGRMAASNTLLNIDATCQVAHAISTHAVSNEYDYFTAVDDCQDQDNAGAAYLDTNEYNSSTLYRYATINVREFAKLVEANEVKMGIEAFIEAFALSMPTGKQNSFANRTVPDMVYVTLRRDQPVNLVGAFEKPVYANKEGYVGASVDHLVNYAEKVYTDFVEEPEAAWQVGTNEENFGEKITMKKLPEAVWTSVNSLMQ